MQADKFYYFNSYNFISKPVLLIALSILLANCEQRKFNQATAFQNPNPVSETAVNLNTASAEELEKLPRVGKETAKNIVAYREKYGKFRRTENLILVDGMSDKKFRAMQNLVKVE